MKKLFRVQVVGNLDECYEIEADNQTDAEEEAVRKFYAEHAISYWSEVVPFDSEEL